MSFYLFKGGCYYLGHMEDGKGKEMPDYAVLLVYETSLFHFFSATLEIFTRTSDSFALLALTLTKLLQLPFRKQKCELCSSPVVLSQSLLKQVFVRILKEQSFILEREIMRRLKNMVGIHFCLSFFFPKFIPHSQNS